MEFGEILKKTISDKTQEILDTSKAIWGNISNAIGGAVDGAKKWVSDRWSDISKTTSDTWDNVKKWTSDKWNDAKKSISDTADSIGTKVSTKWSEVKKKVHQMLGTM